MTKGEYAAHVLSWRCKEHEHQLRMQKLDERYLAIHRYLTWIQVVALSVTSILAVFALLATVGRC